MSSVEYKRYRRSQIAELADWTPGFDMAGVSVSDADKQAGSPKHGDKIARNPANHADRWLVAADYFAANFEAAIKAAQPEEMPSTADDEATRWRHGEPTQPERVSVPRYVLNNAIDVLERDGDEYGIAEKIRAVLPAAQEGK